MVATGGDHPTLRHYLAQGVPKAEIARRVGVSRRTVYHWIETGQLDRDLDAEPVRYGPRRRAPSKLDPYKPIIDERLATYPKLSATRLYQEVRESGYGGSYSQVKRYARRVRPRPEPEPERRFETPPGRQGQVDFADFVLPWGRRHALVVVLGYSRMLWLQYYERQTMETVVRAVVLGDHRHEGGRLLENREFLRFSTHWASASGRAGRAVRRRRGRWSDRSATCAAASSTVGSSSPTTTSTLGLRRWLDTVANVRVHGTLMQRPVARFEDERSRLLPLVLRPYRSVVAVAAPPAASSSGGPLVAVERRPLAEYARIAEGAS